MSVNVSSISRNSSGVVTVTTATAHGLAANQGFSIAGSSQSAFNVNGAIISVNTATTFTFGQSGGTLSAGATGTVSPAKEVIILQTLSQSGNEISVQYALWMTTIYPVPGASASAWSGANSQEIAAIAAGTTIEKAKSIVLPASLTNAQIKVFLQADFVSEQAYLASLTPQPGQYYGVWWDGAAWSA